MKRSIFFTGVVLLALTACQDDALEEKVVSFPATVGEDIQFAAVHGIYEFSDKNGSRTIYGDRDGDSYPIYWVNGDQIGIYCPQASAPQPYKEFTYEVQVDNENSTTGTLAKVNPGENGLQWSSEDEHDFYAIYPASASKGGTSATSVTLNLPSRQSPISIKKEGNTWTAYPNMNYAYMYAHTEVSRLSQGDKPISLNFKPMVTTLEITVNGPDGTGPQSLQVSQVLVRSSVAISGDFALTVAGDVNDPEDGKCSAIDEGVVNTDITIPTYYQNETGGWEPVTLGVGEKLVVKAFMLPYANPEASQTAVTVNMVGQGSNTKILSTADIKARKINITSLPALRGTDFYYWLSALNENTYFSQLSIPGTHNSYSVASDVTESNTVMGAYQKRTIEEQFQAGARAFSFMVGFRDEDFEEAVSYGRSGTFASYTYWNDDYSLYVYDANTQKESLSIVLENYASMLKNAIDNYKEPQGRTCQEFIVLNINYKQMVNSRTNLDNTKYREVRRWIREIDRILDNFSSEKTGIELVRGVTPETTIADLKGKILVFVNYQAPNLPQSEGAVEAGLIGGEEYAGFTFTPSTDVKNYVFMRQAYDEKGEDIMSTLYSSNDRDITYPYYMIPEGPGSGIHVWKQHMERLENPENPNIPNTSTFSGRIQLKIDITKNFFQKAIENNNLGETSNWFVNNLGGFCIVNEDQSYNTALGQSGNTVLAANQINGPIYEYLANPETNSGPIGIVLMNFFGEAFVNSNVASGGQRDVYGQWLPQIVVENNFRFQLKIKGDGNDSGTLNYDATFVSGGNAIQ